MEGKGYVVPRYAVLRGQGSSSTLYRGRMKSYNAEEQSTVCGCLNSTEELLSTMRQHRGATAIVGMTQSFTEAQHTSAVCLVVHWAGAMLCDRCVEECQGARFKSYQFFSPSSH